MQAVLLPLREKVADQLVTQQRHERSWPDEGSHGSPPTLALQPSVRSTTEPKQIHMRDLVSNLLKSKTPVSTPAFAHPSIQVSAQFDTAQRGLSAMFLTFLLATEVKPHSATLISGSSSTTFFWNS